MAYQAAKRMTDVGVSLVGFLILLPLLIMIGIAVRVDSPGPALFRQARMGRGRRPFTLLKFRTMVHGASGAAVTGARDTRITRLGRLLRRSKLDELPQLWNVLVGDMSLVGPRPEVERYVDLFASDYEAVLAVRPGLTDFAAIEYRNEEQILARAEDPEAEYCHVVLPAKIALYRRYLAERSMRTDLKIIAKTVTAVLR